MQTLEAHGHEPNQEGYQSLTAAEVAARLDRLPPSSVHWLYCLIAMFSWALISAGASFASFIYPYVWENDFTHFQYSWLNAIQVGIGVAVGAYIGGRISDAFGRKWVLVSGSILAGLCVLLAGYAAPHYAALMILAFVQAIGVGFVISMSTLYMHEIAPPRFRGRLTLGSQASTAIWSILGFVVGYVLVPDGYRLYLYIMGIFTLIAGAALIIVPESPRWQISKGHNKAAFDTLTKLERKVQRRIGRPLDEPQYDLYRETEAAVTGNRVRVRYLLRAPHLKKLLVLLPAWFLGYSGIVYGFVAYQSIFLSDYGFDSQQFFVVMMLMYGPGYAGGALVFSFFNERIERRTSIWYGSLIFAASFVVIWFFSYIVQVDALLYLGWMFAGAGSAVWLFNMHNYTPNVFPTHMRSTATGLTFGIGHTGALFGGVVVVALGDATSSHGFYGFIVYCAVVGGLLPALLVRLLGVKQSGKSVENISAE